MTPSGIDFLLMAVSYTSTMSASKPTLPSIRSSVPMSMSMYPSPNPSSSPSSQSASPNLTPLQPQLSAVKQLNQSASTSSSTPISSERICSSCCAVYSSGNWYKNKEKPGAYICKSCYVCLNRQKRNSIIKSMNAAPDPYMTTNFTTPSPMRKRHASHAAHTTINSHISTMRVCAGCQSPASSGDWYKSHNTAGGYLCQKCYQRNKRAKEKRRADEWAQNDFLNKTLALAAATLPPSKTQALEAEVKRRTEQWLMQESYMKTHSCAYEDTLKTDSD